MDEPKKPENMTKLPSQQIDRIEDMPGKPLATMSLDITGEKVRIYVVLSNNLRSSIDAMRTGGHYDAFQQVRNDMLWALGQTLDDTFNNDVGSS